MAEEGMCRLQCRGSIARAAIVVALLSSRAADAQGVFDPGPTQAHGYQWYVKNSGVQLELSHQAKAERRLQKLEAKLGQDAGRGDADAVDCDARRIDNARFWIAVDEWLIRKHLLLDPGYYPIRLVDVPCTTYAI